MTPLRDIYSSFPGVLIIIAALILVIMQLAVLMHSVRDKRNIVSLCIAAVHFILGITVFALMLYAEDIYEELDSGEVWPANTLEAKVFAVPWAFYAVLEMIAAAVICLQIRRHLRYAKTHLTADTVKDTLDWLPVGVCIGDAEGNVLLSNLQMNALSQNLTNRYLIDANYLWEQITENGIAQDDGVLCEDGDGKAWLFTKKPMTLCEKGHERKLEQIFASDMTDAYRITQELSENNKHLKDVQFRMKAVAARERSLIAAREVVKARTAVHNQMGGVLLAGRYFMEHPEDTDQAELLHLLEYNNFFLLGEVKQQELITDKLDAALKMAKRIGVTVEIKGVLPVQKSVRNVLAEAVEQCAANAVRHAEGNCLNVIISESDEQYAAVFTNNGKPPEQEIKETGGLTYLRRTAESAGGTMAVESIPFFRLTVTVPKHI